ncbi:hypothetical protein CON09_08325 [Bacillus anthracis]|nr:hypothetical protein CON09_08325 [Bacillus anthracis]
MGMQFKGSDVDGKSYVNNEREQYKKRTGFTDTQYYKIVTLSCKFYIQGFETGQDIQGNPLSEEEISICKMLYDKMQGEIALAREKHMLDKEEQS